jgi:hypothetical protein
MTGLSLCKWLNFPKGGNPHFLCKISCSHVLLTKWCTSLYMGQRFSPEIWVEMLKSPPPRKFHSLTPEILGGGAKFLLFRP